MATVVDRHELHDTLDFVVESAEGDLGRVEEVWLGPADEPQALAVRLRDGSRALLLAQDVIAVDREHRWVVVDPSPELLELDAPRLDGDGSGRLAASWTTTGAVVHPEPPQPLAGLHRRLSRHVPRAAERPLWQLIAILYTSLTVIVLAVVGLVFLVSWLAGGAPY
jgi:hypothetical protein